MRETATATVLFTDVVGSTELRTAVGDDRADDLRRSHDATVGSAIDSHGGRVLKLTGDGVMAVFIATGAAVRAGIEIQRGVARMARQLEVGVEVRVGISAGDVEWDGDDCFGLPVVEAARLCDAAAPSQILAADVVRVLAGSRGNLEFRAVGEVTLAGLEGVRLAHEVPWAEPQTERLPLPVSMVARPAVGLVGRDAELARLERAWSDAANRDAGVVFVSGEPGIGKTRLVTELAKRVWERGGPVVLGRCEDGVRSPLRPIIEIVAQIVRDAPASSLARLSEPHRRVLARLVPELDPDAASEQGTDPLVEVALRAAALRALFAVIEDSEALLVVFDDVHWADSDTLSVLRHLLSDRTGSPMLVVVTYRDTDLDRVHPLAAMLVDLRRTGSADRIVLRGLDRAGAGVLIEQWAGHEVPAAFVEAVVQETEGNPFFVEEVLRHLAETGAITVDDTGRWTSDRPLGELGIPEGVRETVGRRLARFDERTSRLLATAAVVGREFDLDIVATVAELSFDDAITALEPAVAASLVAESAVIGRFAFAHALVRATLIDELVTVRRIRTHQRIAEAIESLRASEIDEHVEDLAYHYGEAAAGGAWPKAINYRLAAAQRASRLGSLDASVAHLDRALELFAISPLDDPRLHSEILARLGWALSAGFDRPRAIAVSEQAFELAIAVGDAELIARSAHSVANLFEAGAQSTRLFEQFDAALRAIPPDREAERAAIAALRTFGWASSARDRALYERALAEAEATVETAERLGESWPDRNFAYLALSNVWITRSTPERALEAIDQFVRANGASPDLRAIANAHTRRIVSLGQLARRADFDEAVRQLEESPASRAIPLYQANVHSIHASVVLLEGRLADAQASINDVRAIAGDLPNNKLGADAQGILLLLERGEAEPDRFARLARSSPFPWVRALEALVWAESGEHDRALLVLEGFAEQDDFGIPYDLSQAQTLRVLAEVVAHLGQREHAEALLPHLVPYSGQLLVSYMFTTCEGSADRAIGQLQSVLGDDDAAIASYETALHIEEGFGARALAARTQAWMVRALRAGAATSDNEPHDELVDAVTRTASELGLVAVRSLID